jgi:hypothetical protein
LKARDTVMIDTPARSATVLIVVICGSFRDASLGSASQSQPCNVIVTSIPVAVS